MMSEMTITNRRSHKIAGVLSLIFIVIGILCLLYFVVILLYAGIETSFCWIWVLMSQGAWLMSHFIRTAMRDRSSMPRFFPTFVFTSFGIFCFVFLAVMCMVVGVSGGVGDGTEADYLIVPGARVYSNGISKTLKYRLDEALSYYRDHPGTVIVLSGGQESTDAVPEAIAMFNYLSMNDVPTQRMLIDAEGVSTADIIRRALLRIEEDSRLRRVPAGPGEPGSDDELHIAVVTSDYHLMRCLKVMEKEGVEKPMGIPAQSDKVLFLHQCVRESMAIVKDYLMGNFVIDKGDFRFDFRDLQNHREPRGGGGPGDGHSPQSS